MAKSYEIASFNQWREKMTQYEFTYTFICHIPETKNKTKITFTRKPTINDAFAGESRRIEYNTDVKSGEA